MNSRTAASWFLTVFGAVVLLLFTALALIAVLASLLNASIFVWIIIYTGFAAAGMGMMVYGHRMRVIDFEQNALKGAAEKLRKGSKKHEGADGPENLPPLQA